MRIKPLCLLALTWPSQGEHSGGTAPRGRWARSCVHQSRMPFPPSTSCSQQKKSGMRRAERSLKLGSTTDSESEKLRNAIGAGKYEKHSYANHTAKADICAALMAGTGVVL